MPPFGYCMPLLPVSSNHWAMGFCPVSPHACVPNHPSSLVGPCPHARGINIQCPRGWVLDHPLHRIPLGQAVTAKTNLGHLSFWEKAPHLSSH